MGALDKIQFLAIKRRALESAMADMDKEDLADRIILLLNGDMEQLNALITGVPYSLKNPVDRVNLEKYIREQNRRRIVRIRDVSFGAGGDVDVFFDELNTVYLKPDNTEGADRIKNGGPTYNEDIKWSQNEDYSMACDYEVKTDVIIKASTLEAYGIEFNKI